MTGSIQGSDGCFIALAAPVLPQPRADGMDFAFSLRNLIIAPGLNFARESKYRN